MPLDGNGRASKPTGTTAAPNTTIASAAFNSVIDDIYSILNQARPVAYGGTGQGTVIAAWDALNAKGSDIASASSINLTTATGPNVTITGTTAVTSVTLGEGKVRMARAAAAFELTASANLVVNGSASQAYTTTANDLLVFIGGAGSVVYVWALGAPGGDAEVTGTNELWIPAGAFVPQITNGPAAGVRELGTNLQPLLTLDFDASTQEFAVAYVPLPKRWDLGTVTFKAYWTAASGSGGVAFALQGAAIIDDDALNPSYGTEQVVTDTLIAANDLHISAASSAITIGGTPADGDLLCLRVKRVPSNGSDTLGVDAQLLGIKLFYTVDQGNDA